MTRKETSYSHCLAFSCASSTSYQAPSVASPGGGGGLGGISPGKNAQTICYLENGVFLRLSPCSGEIPCHPRPFGRLFPGGPAPRPPGALQSWLSIFFCASPTNYQALSEARGVWGYPSRKESPNDMFLGEPVFLRLRPCSGGIPPRTPQAGFALTSSS
jgi:hypothetical protein